MHRHELISKLLETSDKRTQKALLQKNSALLDSAFAEALKNTYYDSWTTEPKKTRNAARALEILAEMIPADNVRGFAAWVRGIADLTEGKLEKTVADLDAAAAIFRKIGEEHQSAQTQVAKLIALALLGRYEDAVKTGEAALKIFEKYGDELAAGKIEKNLGNIVARQGREKAAEKYYLAARRRFIKLGNRSELAMSDNSLANTYSELNDFRQAEKFYGQALESALAEKMFVTEAEIEASLGNLSFYRGRFDEALRYLEISRQKYAELKMPHQTAIAELEIADIYLELNLIDEAFEIYKRVADSLKKLKLQGEEARARANFGKAALLKRQFRKAFGEFEKSARLFIREKNPNGAAGVKIAEASAELAGQNYDNALKIVLEAEKLLARAENPRLKILARWLDGEILRNLGRFQSAEKILLEAYAEAVSREQSNLAQLCLNSLGNLALQKNDSQTAKQYFKRAVKMIETMRAPLAAEEFRMAFLADKLAPFENLAKIYLAENDLGKAFSFIEKARARTLSENLSGAFLASPNEESSKLFRLLEDLREELNWFYSRLNRPADGETAKLQKEAQKRERQIASVMRQIESTRAKAADDPAKPRSGSEGDELKELQKSLGESKALLEYTAFGGVLSAFIMTNEKIEFVSDLADESEVLQLLEGLQFQFGALRYGAKNLGAFLGELKKRADFYLEKLYEKLVRPLENFLAARHLIVVPVGATHYIPFHALRKDARYLIETREVVYAPSASVWQTLNRKPERRTENALLIGYADERIPLVEREIESLKEIFPAAKTFTGETANFQNYRQNAPHYDILHLACHGQFRPENPMFSSLHLADGFVTVRDICAQKLGAALVTLSACETGLNKIYAGDEILGLARGFLAAGAESLCLSLWTVSDEAATRLMRDLYVNLQRGASASASLREAQINFIKQDVHPYFWSPFALIGK